MHTRAVTKKGDIFSVKIDENSVKYFQYIASDLAQLNSDVIRAFKKVYSVKDESVFKEIVGGEVEFYAHTSLNAGMKRGLWEKVGNDPNIGDISSVLFRDSSDVGHGLGQTPVEISEKWYVWRIGEEQRFVGRLEGENCKAEIGIVINPKRIVDWMSTGKYHAAYPGY